MILTLCSVSTTCRDALANFGTEPLGVFAFAITTLGDNDEAVDSTERPGADRREVREQPSWVDELAPRSRNLFSLFLLPLILRLPNDFPPDGRPRVSQEKFVKNVRVFVGECTTL